MPHVTIVDMHNDLFRISVMVDRFHILLDECLPPHFRTVVSLPEYELVAFHLKTRLIWLVEGAVGIDDMESELWGPSRQG